MILGRKTSDYCPLVFTWVPRRLACGRWAWLELVRREWRHDIWGYGGGWSYHSIRGE